MTTRLTQFGFFLSLLMVFSIAVNAQKFQNKGDLKPVIENVFIWHVTHTAVDIDRGGSNAMDTGTFNGGQVSGNETSTTGSNTEGVDGSETTEEETSTDNIPVNEHEDASEPTEETDASDSTPFNSGGILSDNPIPSRGGESTESSDEPTMGETSNVSVEGILGDKMDESILEQIVSYPNPASNQINILVPATNEVVRIRLISLAGQPVINQTAYGNSRLVLETYNLPEGVYLLEFTSESKQYFRRTYIKR